MFCMRVPLTYLSMKAILERSPYEMRRKLAERVVSMREFNKKIPFYFNQVKLSNEHIADFSVQIDQTTWVFKTVNRREWKQGSKMYLVNAKGAKRTVTLRDVHALIEYFFLGKTRKINRLVIEEFQIWPQLVCVPVVNLLIFNSNSFVARSLEAFSKSTIDKMIVNVDDRKRDWNHNLSKIKCNSARITTSVRTSSTFFDSINFPRTEIRESNSTVDKIWNVLKTLENAKNLEEYSYCADKIDNGTELWERLKSEYSVEMEHKNFLLINMNGFKILVERWIDCIGSGFAHRVQKVKEGTEIGLLERKRIEYSPALIWIFILFSTLNHLFRLFRMYYSNFKYNFYMDVIVPLTIILRL